MVKMGPTQPSELSLIKEKYRLKIIPPMNATEVAIKHCFARLLQNPSSLLDLINNT